MSTMMSGTTLERLTEGRRAPTRSHCLSGQDEKMEVTYHTNTYYSKALNDTEKGGRVKSS